MEKVGELTDVISTKRSALSVLKGIPPAAGGARNDNSCFPDYGSLSCEGEG